jgi:hypothetical protein
LKGRYFDYIDGMTIITTASLKAIPQNQFQIVLKGGLGASQGEYFEGDHSDIQQWGM